MTFDQDESAGPDVEQSHGTADREGKRYTLAIDREWRDANGVSMIAPFMKTFRGGLPMGGVTPRSEGLDDHDAAGGSRDPLVVNLGRPMNYTLLQRMLKVSGPRGEVAGTLRSRERNRVALHARRSVARGRYRLVVDTSLEDLAGNKIGQPFDIDVFDRVTERITSSTTTLPFEIR
jgi:hypothetical protein